MKTKRRTKRVSRKTSRKPKVTLESQKKVVVNIVQIRLQVVVVRG